MAASVHIDEHPQRGVGWVLRTATCIAVLGMAAALLLHLACLLRAEQLLARAARAATVEATLPRASSDTVRAVAQRRLSAAEPSLANASVQLSQNGRPVIGPVRRRSGDRLSVSISVPAYHAQPAWLASLFGWLGSTNLAVHAERQWPAQ